MYKRNYVKTERRPWAGGRKKLSIAASILVVLYFLTTFVLGEMGLVKYFRMKAQYTALNADLARLKNDNSRLRREVHSLRSDTAHMERIARDKLGLARPGEIVYYYNDKLD